MDPFHHYNIIFRYKPSESNKNRPNFVLSAEQPMLCDLYKTDKKIIDGFNNYVSWSAYIIKIL